MKREHLRISYRWGHTNLGRRGTREWKRVVISLLSHQHPYAESPAPQRAEPDVQASATLHLPGLPVSVIAPKLNFEPEPLLILTPLAPPMEIGTEETAWHYPIRTNLFFPSRRKILHMLENVLSCLQPRHFDTVYSELSAGPRVERRLVTLPA